MSADDRELTIEGAYAAGFAAAICQNEEHLARDRQLRRKVSGMDIFDMREGRGTPSGYLFVIPHVALSTRDIRVEFRDGEWHLSYEENGRTYCGHAENSVGAHLALIADRMHLHAVVTEKPEEDG